MKWDLVALGNPVYDEIVTPYISTHGRILSGCSTNACLAAKKLGLKRVGLIGSIGQDYKPRFLADLAKYGITPLAIIDSQETGGFGLVYQDNGDRTLDVLGKALPITVDSLPSECLNARMISIGPILGEISFEVLEYLATSTSAEIFIDPQGFLREIQPNGRIAHVVKNNLVKMLAEHCQFLKPNEHEAKVMTGSEAHQQTAEHLVKLGTTYGIVTLADRGSIIADDKSTWRIPAFATIARDPTGCGDTYMGSFIYSWLKHDYALAEHAVFASAAASLMVEQIGPDFEMPLSRVYDRAETITAKIAKIR